MSELSVHKMGGMKTVPMHGKIANGITYVPDMALTLTGDNEVGVGAASGSPVFGVVASVTVTSTGEAGKPAHIHLTMQIAGFTETVKMTATAANRPTVGMPAYCNEKGELVKSPDILAGMSRGQISATNPKANTATVAF